MEDSILVLDGAPSEKSVDRRRIYVGKEERWLTAEMFRYLVQIAIARTISPDGSVAGLELDGGSGLWCRYLYRLRKESGLIFITNRSGLVKLAVEPKRIFFNHKQLALIPDHRITEPVAKHCRKLQAAGI